MTCEECELLLAQDEASPEAETHVAGCPDCRSRTAAMSSRPAHPWWKWSSAAAALLLTSTAAWFASRPAKPPQIVSVDVKVTGVAPTTVMPVPSKIPETLTPVPSAEPLTVKMLTPDPLVLRQGKQPVSQASHIELTVYLLSGLPRGETADDVPQDLGATAKQLRSIFNYKSYKLTGSFMLRGRLGGSARAAGVLPGGGGLNYEFQYNTVTASNEMPPMFRINELRIMLTKAPRRLGGQTVAETVASIHTDLDIREGRKTVVGKSSVNSTGDALILVIVPKIVD